MWTFYDCRFQAQREKLVTKNHGLFQPLRSGGLFKYSVRYYKNTGGGGPTTFLYMYISQKIWWPCT